MNKKKVIGIVLLVLGVMAVFGGFVNGTWAGIGEMNVITAVTMIALEAAMIIGGIYLIVKNK